MKNIGENITDGDNAEIQTSRVRKRKLVPATENDVHESILNRIPKNTRAKVKSNMSIFDSWYNEWRMRCDGLKVWKEKEEWGKSDLDFCLQYFFLEVIKIAVI